MRVHWPIATVALLLLLGLSIEKAVSNETPSSLFPQPAPRPESSPAHPSQTHSEIDLAELEKEVFEQVNQHRATVGLPPLQLDSRLSQQAKAHSQDMANKLLPVGHANLKTRARKIGRLVSGRRLRISENVAYIFSHDRPAKRAVDGWLRSEHHRPVVEGDYRLTGVGVAIGDKGALYFTQLYVRSR